LGERGGLNLYGYVENNPICYVDPFGLVWYNPASWAPIVAAGNAVGDAYSFITGIPDAQENYNRNQYNFAPPTESDLGSQPGFWRSVDSGEAKAHQEGTCPGQGNNKYVSPNGHYEAVYDANGNLVTNGPNIGTYNFYNYQDGVSGFVGHWEYDVLPWIEYGASPGDPQGRMAEATRAYNLFFSTPNRH
jgi:hypothetical protein